MIGCQQQNSSLSESSVNSAISSNHFLELKLGEENNSLDQAVVTLVTTDGLYTDSTESLNDFFRQNLTVINGFFIEIQPVSSEDSNPKNYTIFIKPESPGGVNLYLAPQIVKYDASNVYENESSLNITVQ